MFARASQSPYVRPLGALGLLTIEYLCVTLVFDAYQLVEADGALGGLGWMGLVGPAVMAFGTALWILGGDRVRAALASTPALDAAGLRPRLAVHLACFAVFFVVTALLFTGSAAPPGPSWVWVGLWLLAGAVNIGSLVPIAFGSRRLLALTRELAVPLAVSTLLALVAMGAGLATVLLWDELAGVTLHSVAFVLDVVVSPIYFVPSELLVGTEQFSVEVAPVCSGYEGIGLIFVFLAAYLVTFRKRLRFPNVLVVVPAAILVVWLLNVLRIVTLILVGHLWSPDIAVGGFHSKAGWLLFCGVALGTVWLTQRVTWFTPDSTRKSARTTNPSAPFLLPLLCVVATALVTGLVVDEFDYFYPLRVVVALLVLAWYRDEYVTGFRAHLGDRPILSWHAPALGTLVYVVWIGLSSWSSVEDASASPPSEISDMAPPLAAAWIAARAFGSIVTVPIIEELAFRGFLLRRLIGRDFTKVPYDQWSWLAVLVSSIAFAAVHQQWIGGLIAGVLYAYAQKHRGLLSDAIIAHAVTNALIALQVVVFGHWALW